MKTWTAFLLLGILALGAGGFYYYERQIALLQQLTYQLISVNVTNLTAQLATVNLVIRISSQSTLDAQVVGLYVDVYIGGTKMGSITSNQGFIIPARASSAVPGYSDVPLQVNISPELLVGDVGSLLLGLSASQDLVINLIGYVQIKEVFLNVTVPFNYTTSIKQIIS